MIIRFCPFCSSKNIRMFQKTVTPEEERDTEFWACPDCNLVMLRERNELEDKWQDLIKEYGFNKTITECVFN